MLFRSMSMLASKPHWLSWDRSVPAALRIRSISQDDRESLRKLLAAARLEAPCSETASMGVVAQNEEEPVACAYVESYGRIGLLRSVAVSEGERRRGIGLQIVTAAEVEARRSGIEVLYLLTETAQSFFHRLGYRTVERGSAPPEITVSDQFVRQCPVTATLMARDL